MRRNTKKAQCNIRFLWNEPGCSLWKGRVAEGLIYSVPPLISKNDLPKTADFVLGLDVFLSIVCYFRAFGHSVHVLQERPQAFRRLYG